MCSAARGGSGGGASKGVSFSITVTASFSSSSDGSSATDAGGGSDTNSGSATEARAGSETEAGSCGGGVAVASGIVWMKVIRKGKTDLAKMLLSPCVELTGEITSICKPGGKRIGRHHIDCGMGVGVQIISIKVFVGWSIRVGSIRERSLLVDWGRISMDYIISPLFQKPKPNCRSPLLLVHGFGASIAHWRRNIPTLAQSHTVYAVDLLGFGGSDKPAGFQYSMEVWAQLILDFLDEIVQKPTVLMGNSVGSLACVIAAAESSRSLVRGLVLFNCAGGMNNKAIVDDWRIKLLLPLLWFFDFLLKQRGIASYLFDRVRQRENLRNVLLSVYGNKESVDDDLVEIIRKPALDEGALDAFVSIVTGPPGPNPVQLIPNITLPVLVLWGDQDPFTPIDGPVGKYFSSLPGRLPNVNLFLLEGVGHCPHDDRPDLVHEKLLPWLANLPV
ncbi:hypothetical protein DH2020_036626 [Rehmannia glutinosa]|uniref:AB hydrolase-1 domain-containing protein n=1 Tax=Rehmannia glutinosa TaxID=99300 RepID=A0ABR0V5M7_REHGL